MLKAKWYFLGQVEYARAYELQLWLSKKLKGDEEFCGYLLFLEHPPTITFGYSLKGDEGKSELRADEKELAEKGIAIFHTDRGGKATYHGPGQLICYPIFKLNQLRLSSKRYVHRLEDVVIGWLREQGLNAERDPAYPGVWVENRKIASVGVRIEDRISRHGFALNLNPDLGAFELIVPCGIQHRKMTSFFKETGKKIGYIEAIKGLLEHFQRIFQLELIKGDVSELENQGGADDNQRMAHSRAV